MIGLLRQLAFDTGCRSVMKIINCQSGCCRKGCGSGMCRELGKTCGGEPGGS